MAVALPSFLVKIAILLLSTGIGWSVSSYAADGDPFAQYHQALEQRLIAIAEAPRPANPPRVLESNRSSDAEPASATVSEFARRYWNGRDADLRAAIARLTRYRPALESVLEQEGVPKSLVAVVLVESAAQPLALSPKQARGLWQFIPATARQYGLAVTQDRDERIDVERATRAAARFLRALYTQFGDWELALAAYNAGPDRIQRALQRRRASSYSQISEARLLPEETRIYVPAVLSAIKLLGTASLEVETHEKRTGSAKVIYAPAGIAD